MIVRIMALAFVMIAYFSWWNLAAKAHDLWANGTVVPPWVKSSCCGTEDVHHLTNSQVQARPDGWHVEGYPTPISYDRTLPSQDGDYWVFYKKFASGVIPEFSPVYCFFAPAQGF